jgi:hypothetical protein
VGKQTGSSDRRSGMQLACNRFVADVPRGRKSSNDTIGNLSRDQRERVHVCRRRQSRRGEEAVAGEWWRGGCKTDAKRGPKWAERSVSVLPVSVRTISRRSRESACSEQCTAGPTTRRPRPLYKKERSLPPAGNFLSGTQDAERTS